MGDCQVGSTENPLPTIPTLIWTTGAGPDIPDGCVVPDGIPPNWLGERF